MYIVHPVNTCKRDDSNRRAPFRYLHGSTRMYTTKTLITNYVTRTQCYTDQGCVLEVYYLKPEHNLCSTTSTPRIVCTSLAY